MNISPIFRSGFKVARYVIPASTPTFSLACNVYTHQGSARPAANISAAPASQSAPPLLFTHANGFCKETWEPVMSRLAAPWINSEMYAFDCRNQGDSAVLNKDILPDTFDWYSYATDILKVIDTFSIKKPVGIGHSFGASAFILAESMRPGTFSAIVAIDPTMFPREIFINAPLDDHPMAQITLKRRDTWKDKAECKAKLLEKRFFRAFHPDALDLYVEYGMVDVENADGSKSVTLKCSKFQEAITFAHEGTGLHDAFENLSTVNVPVHIIAGETSDIK
ncbi:hypothetical protein BGW38_003796 [Lunasporangiospora selenospora]|uniref:AB hydrolase-1 domain-containing protein n=1 Tax=Lunasporangiospora selenospora TaxID=979761 RepID=A0A9P6FQ44_9FUNG|nr:hypothetical protein BGW38_003796 [Lunasporangiospora selenospora]